mmetsp:Transcript_105793/g.341170  ORF Transcript_105793/g.341170 Transcript_105793/m.341170 type:complete len:315 (-) Transcript_105793:217-1161(-)
MSLMGKRLCKLKPVAETTTSALSTSAEASLMPCGTNSAMWSVTKETAPEFTASKRSPSATTQSRCSHGLYFGVKCFFVLAWHRFHDVTNQRALGFVRERRRDFESRHRKQNILPTRCLGSECWRNLVQACEQWALLSRARDQERGRPLEQLDMRGRLGQFWRKRNGRRATPDDDDSLARDVQISGPAHRMHQAASEVRYSRVVRDEALVVLVVAGAEVQKVACETASRCVQRPQSALRVILRPLGPASEAHALDDAVPLGHRAQILLDFAPFGQGMVALPQVERVGERVHVRVAPHAGIPPKVPSATEIITALK